MQKVCAQSHIEIMLYNNKAIYISCFLVQFITVKMVSIFFSIGSLAIKHPAAIAQSLSATGQLPLDCSGSLLAQTIACVL